MPKHAPDFALEQAELDALVAGAESAVRFVLISEQQHKNIVGANVRVPSGWAHSSVDRLTRKHPQRQHAPGYPGPCRGPQ